MNVTTFVNSLSFYAEVNQTFLCKAEFSKTLHYKLHEGPPSGAKWLLADGQTRRI